MVYFAFLMFCLSPQNFVHSSFSQAPCLSSPSTLLIDMVPYMVLITMTLFSNCYGKLQSINDMT
jgi:hypothetical protein